MISALIVFYFVIAVLLIILVLLQDPKGDGAIFGGGGSQSLFGATGATSFTVKATRLVAILFAVSVIGINYMLMSGNNKSAVYDNNAEITAPILEEGEESESPLENEEVLKVKPTDSKLSPDSNMETSKSNNKDPEASK